MRGRTSSLSWKPLMRRADARATAARGGELRRGGKTGRRRGEAWVGEYHFTALARCELEDGDGKRTRWLARPEEKVLTWSEWWSVSG